jgi:hypothetical protein
MWEMGPPLIMAFVKELTVDVEAPRMGVHESIPLRMIRGALSFIAFREIMSHIS